MFDIGFPELLLLAVVSLIFIGPKELPGAMRSLALWIGWLKRSLAQVREDIEAEIGADEIRQDIHNAGIMQDLRRTRDDLQNTIDDSTSAVRQGADELKNLGKSAPGSQTEAPTEAGGDTAAKNSSQG